MPSWSKDRILSVESLPSWWEQEAAWQKLTFGGELFEHLQDCVQRRDFAELQQVFGDLQTVHESVCFLQGGVYQFSFSKAQTLTQLAIKAAEQSLPDKVKGLPPGEARKIARGCLLSSEENPNKWEWDVFCAWCSAPREVLPGTAQRISVLLDETGEGCVAVLEVELISGGKGEIYPDPLSNSFIEFDKDIKSDEDKFLTAAARVWDRVKQETAPKPDEREELEKTDARFRLRRLNTDDKRPLLAINGRSAQAAFYTILRQAVKAFLNQTEAILLDQSVAVTATVEDLQRLGQVKSLGSKLQAACREKLALVIVAKQDEAAARQALDDAQKKTDSTARPTATEVSGVNTLDDLLAELRDRAKEREAVRCYEREECRKLNILDREVEIESHYQVLPLLREVKREKLPRTDRERKGEERQQESDDGFPGLRSAELLRWEEKIRAEKITYERYSLTDIFSKFRQVVEEAKSDVPRFIVLGPPGSGKTTLTQYLAWVYCRQGNGAVDGLVLHSVTDRKTHLVPAQVRLREWEAWYVKNSEKGLPEYLTEHYSSSANATAVEHWRRWLQRGEVLLLLDGLDEIKGKPRFIAALKKALATFDKCPTVLTCRTVSFEQHQALGSALPVFIIAGLSDELRDNYIRLFPAKHPDRFIPDDLIAQLNRAPQMRPLATNPLLLSIICYVVDDPRGVSLPATRTELYGKAVERLLARDRGVAVTGRDDLPQIRKRRILERAAFILFTGTEQQRQLTFDEGTLVDALTAAVEQEGYRDPSPVADVLLNDLVKNSGLLRGSKEQDYFFLHLTIQEYLAAAAIAKLVKSAGWETEVEVGGRRETVRQLVDRKAWDPRWQEVIVLLSGQLDKPAPLLDLLSDEQRDDYLRHRLALAALCLPELSSAPGHSPSEAVNRISTAVFSLWWHHHRNRTNAATPHFTCAMSALGQVNGLIGNDTAVDELGRVIKAHSGNKGDGLPLLDLLAALLRNADREVRGQVAYAIKMLGAAAATPEILAALLALLCDADTEVRRVAAEAIGELGATATPEVLEVLHALLLDADVSVRCAAAFAIGRLGAAAVTPEVVAAILALSRDAEVGVRRAAALAIRGLGAAAAMPKILAALLALSRDAEVGVRRAAAEAIRVLGAAVATPEVLATLPALLRDTNVNVRYAAVDAIGGLGPAAATPEILAALLALFRDAEWEVQKEAAFAIKSLGTAAATPEVLATLPALLRDTNVNVRYAAVDAIGGLGPAAATPEILAALLASLRDADVNVRYPAASAIRGLGTAAAMSEVVAAILALSRDAEVGVRRAAAEAIKVLGAAAATLEVLAAILALSRDADVKVRSAAASAIGGLGVAAATPEVLAAILALSRDADVKVRSAAASAIGGLGAAVATPEVLAAILTLSHDADVYVRYAAADAIGGLGPAAATPEVLAALLALLRDADVNVRITAAIAMARIATQEVRIFEVKSGKFEGLTVAELSELGGE